MGLGGGQLWKQVKSLWALKNFQRLDYNGLEIRNSKKQKNFRQFLLKIIPKGYSSLNPPDHNFNITCFDQVSWLRHDDTHLLTIGRLTYTSDLRFKAIHKLYSEDWLLRIKPTTHRDGGRYECQISTTPPTSHIITLIIAGLSYFLKVCDILNEGPCELLCLCGALIFLLWTRCRSL